MKSRHPYHPEHFQPVAQCARCGKHNVLVKFRNVWIQPTHKCVDGVFEAPQDRSQRNTPTMGRRLLAEARRSQLTQHPRGLCAVFEGEQWWIVDNRTGARWSVYDADGPGTMNGFGFEQVTLRRDGDYA